MLGPVLGLNALFYINMKNTLNSHRGFSLIELLVALSILAVVAALIIPRFLNVRTQAADTMAAAQVKSINSIYSQWIALGGTPATIGFNNIYFLSYAASSSTAARATGAATACPTCTDTIGNFGSNSISLSGVSVTTGYTAATLTASLEDGIYGTIGTTASLLKIGNYYYTINYTAADAQPYELASTSGTALTK